MNGSRGLRLLTTPLVGMNWEKMSEYFKSLSNTAKSRYKEKLQAVGLTIEADPYIPGNDNKYLSDNMAQWPRVEYGNIFAYFVQRPGVYTQEQLLSYKQLDSYNYFQNGYVGSVSVWQFGHGDSRCCLLKAYVNPSQRAPQNGHKPWVICKPDGTVITAHCTCMAG